MYYILPILYFSYVILSPVTPWINYCYYEILKSPKQFNIKNCIENETLVVYSSNETSKNKILEKIPEDTCIIVSTDLDTFVKERKLEIDYVIIDCNKHIVFKETVYEEFFKYTGLDKEKFFKFYNKYDSIVLDMKRNEISTFI
jgi:hypothetical protein